MGTEEDLRSEWRVDPLSGRRVVIAPGRASRPGAAVGALEPPSDAELDACPFCEGREDRTPPETYAIAEREREPDTPGWLVRVVPNKYPAFEGHEVVVHSPRHVRSIAELFDDELGQVAVAWQARATAAHERGLPYVHALVNEGPDAGASLPHTHSQLVWLAEEPPVPVAEHDDGGCRLCDLLHRERADGARLVAERSGLVLLAAYAGRMPYELLIAPEAHEPDGLASDRLADALALAAEGVRRLVAVRGPTPVNLWLHNGEHWHVELLPRTTVLAGIELGSGLYLNPVAPEEAAAALRNAEGRQ